MITKVPAGPGKVRVTFSMPAAIWADTIHLVGDFNNWSNTATPLRLSESGWTVTLELEAGRSYQYRYLINSAEWHNDWHADRYEPNEFGGDNSVVVALPLPEMARNGSRAPRPSQKRREPELVEFEATLESPVSNIQFRSAILVHP